MITITEGSKIRTFGGWYRHDTVLVDGIALEGSVCVKRRNKRTEYLTCFRSACVLGTDTQWLIRCNALHSAVGYRQNGSAVVLPD
jgi:hypothetical protein